MSAWTSGSRDADLRQRRGFAPLLERRRLRGPPVGCRVAGCALIFRQPPARSGENRLTAALGELFVYKLLRKLPIDSTKLHPMQDVDWPKMGRASHRLANPDRAEIWQSATWNQNASPPRAQGKATRSSRPGGRQGVWVDPSLQEQKARRLLHTVATSSISKPSELARYAA